MDFSIWLPRTDWELGETINGQLEMQARKDFKLTDLHVELVQSEYVPESSGNLCETGVKATMAGPTIMKAGQKLTLPFQIEIPSSGLPNFSSGHSQVIWKIKGLLTRGLESGFQTSQPLMVYNKA